MKRSFTKREHFEFQSEIKMSRLIPNVVLRALGWGEPREMGSAQTPVVSSTEPPGQHTSTPEANGDSPSRREYRDLLEGLLVRLLRFLGIRWELSFIRRALTRPMNRELVNEVPPRKDTSYGSDSESELPDDDMTPSSIIKQYADVFPSDTAEALYTLIQGGNNVITYNGQFNALFHEVNPGSLGKTARDSTRILAKYIAGLSQAASKNALMQRLQNTHVNKADRPDNVPMTLDEAMDRARDYELNWEYQLAFRPKTLDLPTPYGQTIDNPYQNYPKNLEITLKKAAKRSTTIAPLVQYHRSAGIPPIVVDLDEMLRQNMQTVDWLLTQDLSQPQVLFKLKQMAAVINIWLKDNTPSDWQDKPMVFKVKRMLRKITKATEPEELTDSESELIDITGNTFFKAATPSKLKTVGSKDPCLGPINE